MLNCVNPAKKVTVGKCCLFSTSSLITCTCWSLLSVERCMAARNSCRVIWMKLSSSSTPNASIIGVTLIKPIVAKETGTSQEKSDAVKIVLVLTVPLNASRQRESKHFLGDSGKSENFLSFLVLCFHFIWRLRRRRFNTRYSKSLVWVFGSFEPNAKKRRTRMTTLMGREQKFTNSTLHPIWSIRSSGSWSVPVIVWTMSSLACLVESSQISTSNPNDSPRYSVSGLVVMTILHSGRNSSDWSPRIKWAMNDSCWRSCGRSSQLSNQKHTPLPLCILIASAIAFLCLSSGWGMRSARWRACWTFGEWSEMERKSKKCWNILPLLHCLLACQVRVVLPDPGLPLIIILCPEFSFPFSCSNNSWRTIFRLLMPFSKAGFPSSSSLVTCLSSRSMYTEDFIISCGHWSGRRHGWGSSLYSSWR